MGTEANNGMDIDISTLDIHEECKNQCRSSIIMRYIELYPESLSVADNDGYLPLHRLLMNRSSTIDDALAMIEKYPAALQHQQDRNGYLPLHLESLYRGRSIIIAKCIEIYPDSLTLADWLGWLPLHSLLLNKESSINDALMMIEKYPAAVKHRTSNYSIPLQVECWFNKCRPAILLKCIELYPESVTDIAIGLILRKISKPNFGMYTTVFLIVFTARPMSLYDPHDALKGGIRKNPYYRRKILNLLPRHVFTPIHDADYRDLNWQPRAAMMLLLSQLKIRQAAAEHTID
jgi:hypothetical protein